MQLKGILLLGIYTKKGVYMNPENNESRTGVTGEPQYEEFPADGQVYNAEPVAYAEAVAEPVAEAVAEPVFAEPVAEFVVEPVVEAVAEPVAEFAAEPVAEAVAEPVAEFVAEPVAEAVAEPKAEFVAEPVAEAVAEPVAEFTAEPVAEAVAEPVAEFVAEPVTETDAEPLFARHTAEPVYAYPEQQTAPVQEQNNGYNNGYPSENNGYAVAEYNAPVQDNNNPTVNPPEKGKKKKEKKTDGNSVPKKKGGALPAIIVSIVAVLIIGALCFFGWKELDKKDSQLKQKDTEFEEKTAELTQKSEELDKKTSELAQKEEELKKALEEKSRIETERDQLLAADAERKQKEEEAAKADNGEKDAINNMIRLMDRTEDLIAKVGTEFNRNPSTVSEYEVIKNTIGGYNNEMGAYINEFNTLTGIPQNFRDAGKEFLDSTKDSISSTHELLEFLIDYLKITEMFQDVYDMNNLSRSYENAEKFITLMESSKVPAYIKPIWDRWKDSMEISKEVLKRVYEAQTAGDYLRLSSASNLLNRQVQIIKNLINEMSEVVDSEFDFLKNRQQYAAGLVDQARSAVELDPEARKAYKFNFDQKGEMVLNYKVKDEIYPSLYNSYNYVIYVEAGCYGESKDIVVECEIPGLTQKFENSYRLDSLVTPIYIKPVAVESTQDLSVAWDSTVKITVKDKQGNLLDTKSFPVHICSENDFKWFDDEFGVATRDNILCFLTPQSEAVTQLKRDAIDILSVWTDGKVSGIYGYQGPVYDTYTDTYIQAAALMYALSNMGVRYNNDNFSIDGAGQHILFPAQVLESKTGLCIETSLVIASALQSAGFHTYLIFPPGHAQVAVETWEGSGEYFLVETTKLPCDEDSIIDYANAILSGDISGVSGSDAPVTYLNKEEWAGYLSNSVVYHIDCSDGKLLGLTPFAR